MIDEATGDEQKLQADQIKGQVLKQEYARFSKAAELRQQHDRMETVGYNWKQEKAAGKAFEQAQQKTVENVEKSVIMDTRNGEGGSDVHYITKIDIERYRCITEDITSDEVIITDERIRHIEEHHPGAYNKIETYLRSALDDPDYILEDGKNVNTGLVLKMIEENEMRVQIVLRIHTSADPQEFKNSIISGWDISEQRWKNYINNKKILYKKE